MNDDWKIQGITVCAGETDKRVLLKDVNAQFQRGKITLLIGHNGAGKSTLLETLAGIRPLQNGRIELGDEPLWIQHGRRPRLNRDVTMKLGISMQHSEAQWFAATIREEMRYSMKPYRIEMDTAEQRMQHALKKAGLKKDLLERDPWTLSGGQQRRLSLACLLACDPDWLLLDEPTAGLDADGIRCLCSVLKAHREAGHGAVVATHDLDALLPIADEVAVVHGGVVREVMSADAVPLASHAMLKLSALAAAGLQPQAPEEESHGALWLEPREAAAALASELARPACERGLPIGEINAADETKEAELQSPRSGMATSIPSPQPDEQLRGDRFDPRALIMMYLLLTAGVLAQKDFIQVAIAAVVIAALLTPFRTLIRPWIRVIRAYIMIIIVFCLLTGISFRPIELDWEEMIPTALRLCKLLLVMLLGMPLLKLMTPLRLQRAIEQTFGWLSRLKLPIYSFALLVTLIFRFIPLLTGEWNRFAKLAHARGKVVSPLRSVPFKMIKSVMIPYIRSILRLAEQMADALEARGFGYTKRKPVFGFRLRFGRSDAVLIIISVLSGLLFFLLPIVL